VLLLHLLPLHSLLPDLAARFRYPAATFIMLRWTSI